MRQFLRDIYVTSKRESFYGSICNHSIKNKLIFDIGAFHGEFSKMFYNFGMDVVAFEPNEDNYNEAMKNLRDTNIRVRHIAVSNKKGKRIFWNALGHSSFNLKWAETHPTEIVKGESVDCITLNDLIKTYGLPFLIKIDAESHEPEILSTLGSHRVPFIVFEYHMDREWLISCLKHFDKSYEFNYTSYDHFDLMSEEWLDAPKLISKIFNGDSAMGDIVARRL